MLNRLQTNQLPWRSVVVLGLVLVPVLSLSGATGALAESAQPNKSCKAVGTPYQLKVPFGEAWETVIFRPAPVP
jgi:hypothetical protein